MTMRATDILEHTAFVGARGVLRLMPYKAAEACLRGAARIAGPWGGLRRAVVDRQLAAAFPQRTNRERRRLRNAVYDHLGRMAAEVFVAAPQALASTVRVAPGFGPLDRALAPGRGAIVVTGHLGNFELAGRILAARYPLLDVVKPQRNPAVERELEAMRRAHGIATVPMDRSGKAVLAHLRRGGLVSLLIDQDAGPSGIALDFLGRRASTWPGAARLALRTGCPVVPVAIIREEGGHVLTIGEPLAAEPGPPESAAVAAFMMRLNRELERWVRTSPEQWFWVHRRWKGADRAGSDS